MGLALANKGINLKSHYESATNMQETLIQQTLPILFLAWPAILATIVALAKPQPVLAWVWCI